MGGLKLGGWTVYIATGMGFLVFAALTGQSMWLIPVALIAIGYLLGLSKHLVACPEPQIMSKNRIIYTMLATIGAAGLTWFINHELGYGAMIASGLIGVIAGVTLPNDLAGAAYAASFAGMSANFVLPTLGTALIAGSLAGIIVVATVPIFGGIGGKGGTTAAAAVLMTAALVFTVGA